MNLGHRMVIAALGEYGQAEITGPKANPRIAEYLRSVGLGPEDETPWCASFMHWVASEVGACRPLLKRAAAARSWLQIGTIVIKPEIGDVVIISRPGADWQAHVGLYIADTPDRAGMYVLGGNQKNSVSLAPFPKSQVLGYRRLAPA